MPISRRPRQKRVIQSWKIKLKKPSIVYNYEGFCFVTARLSLAVGLSHGVNVSYSTDIQRSYEFSRERKIKPPANLSAGGLTCLKLHKERIFSQLLPTNTLVVDQMCNRDQLTHLFSRAMQAVAAYKHTCRLHISVLFPLGTRLWNSWI